MHGIRDLGQDTTIGGSDPGAGNIISANGSHGIFFTPSSSGGRLQGNLIGTAADATSPLGNGLAGIDASLTARTAIGGVTAGAGNTIAHNGAEGVVITATFGDLRFSRNAILSNSIFSNAKLGIDLSPEGVTANDPGDADAGANMRQNHPVLAAAGDKTIAGTLDSTPDTTFRLEFFLNSEPDPSGHGEGERFLGAQDVTTDASGKVAFSFASPSSLPDGQFISATATDPANNTSEFSGVVLVTAPISPATLTLHSADGDQHAR